MSQFDAAPSVFDNHAESWRTYVQTPWARVRYSLVAEVLDEHLEALEGGSASARILDFGGGDGQDAVRLAARGHRVTILDTSVAMLEEARSRAAAAGAADQLRLVHGGVEQLTSAVAAGDAYDLVLCHFVIQYVADPASLVVALSSAVRPGGLLTLMAPNPASDVLARAVRDLDPAGALALLDAPTVKAVTFEQHVARIDAHTGRQLLEHAGCAVLEHYGIRAVIDLIADDAAKHDALCFQQIQRLERAVCRRSPYRDVARAWLLVARKDENTSKGAVNGG